MSMTLEDRLDHSRCYRCGTRLGWWLRLLYGGILCRDCEGAIDGGHRQASAAVQGDPGDGSGAAECTWPLCPCSYSRDCTLVPSARLAAARARLAGEGLTVAKTAMVLGPPCAVCGALSMRRQLDAEAIGHAGTAEYFEREAKAVTRRLRMIEQAGG